MRKTINFTNSTQADQAENYLKFIYSPKLSEEIKKRKSNIFPDLVIYDDGSAILHKDTTCGQEDLRVVLREAPKGHRIEDIEAVLNRIAEGKTVKEITGKRIMYGREMPEIEN